MGGSPLTKQVAHLALKKLKASEVTGKNCAHPEYLIYYNGKLEARTSLRHSSTRDIPCNHVKNDLRVGMQFVLELARCTKYQDDWAKAVGVFIEQPAPEEQQKPESGGEPTETK